MQAHGKGVLIHSIQNKNFEMLKVLLKNVDKGFNLNDVDSEGRDALMNVILQNNFEIVELFIEHRLNGLVSNHLD
jgi:ankyrin repeat protein